MKSKCPKNTEQMNKSIAHEHTPLTINNYTLGCVTRVVVVFDDLFGLSVTPGGVGVLEGR